MTVLSFLAVVVLVFPIAVYSDSKNKTNTESSNNGNWNDFVIMFSPFIALFDAEHFWLSLAYCLFLAPYFAGLLYITDKKGFYPFNSEMTSWYYLSGVITCILVYFLFFHEGVLVEETAPAEAVMQKTDAVWPYIAYGVFVVLSLTLGVLELFIKKIQPISIFALMSIAVLFPILPLFSPHYWLSILGVSLTLIFLIFWPSILSRNDGRVEHGFPIMIVYMCTFGLSIILYAFLY